MLLVDDSRSVNEDDIYEDDWEEELKDSEEEGRSRNDKEEEPSENISHVSSNCCNCIYIYTYFPVSSLHPSNYT